MNRRHVDDVRQAWYPFQPFVMTPELRRRTILEVVAGVVVLLGLALGGWLWLAIWTASQIPAPR